MTQISLFDSASQTSSPWRMEEREREESCMGWGQEEEDTLVTQSENPGKLQNEV